MAGVMRGEPGVKGVASLTDVGCDGHGCGEHGWCDGRCGCDVGHERFKQISTTFYHLFHYMVYL